MSSKTQTSDALHDRQVWTVPSFVVTFSQDCPCRTLQSNCLVSEKRQSESSKKYKRYVIDLEVGI